SGVDHRSQYVPLQKPKLPIRGLEGPRSSAHGASQREGEALGERTQVANPKLEKIEITNQRNRSTETIRKAGRQENAEGTFLSLFFPAFLPSSLMLNSRVSILLTSMALHRYSETPPGPCGSATRCSRWGAESPDASWRDPGSRP